MEHRVTRASVLLLIMALSAAAISPKSVHAQDPAATPPAATATASEPVTAAAEPATPAKRIVDYNNPTLEDILDAWQEREEKVKSFKFTWDVEMTTYLVFSETEFGRSVEVAPPFVTPGKGLVFAHQGNGMHLALPLNRSSATEKPHLNSIYRSNGIDTGQTYGPNEPGLKFAAVQSGSTLRDLGLLTISPFLSNYRPMYQICDSYTTVEAFRASNPGVDITMLPPSEAPDQGLAVQLKKPPYRYIYSLKPAVGFPVEAVHLYNDSNGTVDLQPSSVVMELEPHDVVGWIPRKWRKMAFKPDGRLSRMDEAVLSSVAFNETLEPAMFDPMSLPVGTVLNDMRSSSTGTTFRVKAPDELEPYDVFAVEESSAKRESWDFSTIMLGVNLTLFVALFVVWFSRRYRSE